MMAFRLLITLCLIACTLTAMADNSAEDPFLKFIKLEAADLRSRYVPHESNEGWLQKSVILRKQLLQAWGGFPKSAVPLIPRTLGVLNKNGYHIEKLVFQTMPDVWITANAYVPASAGKHPAVLAVHGHWPGAKQDPMVQSRCIGLVKQGYFVLAVDAFGAGERATGKALGEYHGEMSAATLFPTGLTLSGIQVYENLRAVDYLLTRQEVDGTRIGITGASGGGNQTMYAAAWDKRLKAAVPVCSVGNYQAYLGSACCLCEVVPGALRFTEEWGVLALTAPRALLIINATRDAHQFSVPEANKSVDGAQEIYQLLDAPDAIRHVTFESGHDYSSPMRSAMYGWMDLHLKGVGDGSPKPEPEIQTEDPEILRCFPGNSRPDSWVTLPRYAATVATRVVATHTKSATLSEWQSASARYRQALKSKVLGGIPAGNATTLNASLTRDAENNRVSHLAFTPEPGLQLQAQIEQASSGNGPLSIILDLDGSKSMAVQARARALHEAGNTVITLDLRATGIHAYGKDAIGSAPDHNTAEWALWIGRPLLGQWTCDVLRLLDALKSARIKGANSVHLTGIGPAGMVALCAAALDNRISQVTTVGTLASYITDVPFKSQRLGIMAPGILREVGDVAQIASLMAPRKLTIESPVDSVGIPLSPASCGSTFAPAEYIWRLYGEPGRLITSTSN